MNSSKRISNAKAAEDSQADGQCFSTSAGQTSATPPHIPETPSSLGSNSPQGKGQLKLQNKSLREINVELVRQIKRRHAVTEEALENKESRLQSILNAAAESIITVDYEGTIESFNQTAERMFGYQAKEIIGRPIDVLIPHPQRSEHQAYIERYLKRQEPRQLATNREVVAKRKDGSVFPILISVSDVPRLKLFTGVIRDLTVQKAQEEILRESEARYRALFEDSALCLLEENWSGVKAHLDTLRLGGVQDLARHLKENPSEGEECFARREIRDINRAALKLFGASEKNELLCSFRKYIAVNAWEDLSVLLTALFRGQTKFTAETSVITLYGETIPVLFHFEVAAGCEQSFERVVTTIIDIKERKRAEELQSILMAELDHRVKNILATVLSVAQQTLRRTNSLEQFRDAFTGRLSALADVHRLLTAHQWKGVYLQDLVKASTKPYTQEDGPVVTLKGDLLLLTGKGAQAFYMVLHELATNAAKYGALSVQQGRLSIEWKTVKTAEGSRLHFFWIESDGPAITQPSNAGFGSQLIKRTASYELRGDVRFEFKRSGFCCELRVPITPDSKLVQHQLWEEESDGRAQLGYVHG